VCEDIYVTWRENLGEQIRNARIKAGWSQLELAEKTAIKREHISNIELGKNSPAVKIVTDIAKALNTRFHLDGCVIDPSSEYHGNLRPVSVPEQMKLDFGVEYRFSTRIVTLTARSDAELELRAVLSGRKRA